MGEQKSLNISSYIDQDKVMVSRLLISIVEGQIITKYVYKNTENISQKNNAKKQADFADFILEENSQFFTFKFDEKMNNFFLPQLESKTSGHVEYLAKNRNMSVILPKINESLGITNSLFCYDVGHVSIFDQSHKTKGKPFFIIRKKNADFSDFGYSQFGNSKLFIDLRNPKNSIHFVDCKQKLYLHFDNPIKGTNHMAFLNWFASDIDYINEKNKIKLSVFYTQNLVFDNTKFVNRPGNEYMFVDLQSGKGWDWQYSDGSFYQGEIIRDPKKITLARTEVDLTFPLGKSHPEFLMVFERPISTDKNNSEKWTCIKSLAIE